MKAVVINIPDNAMEWPAWLEQQIVSSSMIDLVVGLKAIHPSPDKSLTLEQLCCQQLSSIYHSGLRVLSTDQIRTLFKTPDLLLKLQDLILIEGGTYWDEVEQSSEYSVDVDKHVAKTLTALGASKSTPMQDLSHDDGVSHQPKQTSSDRRGTKSLLAKYWPLLALAAGLLIAFGIWWPSAPSGGGWGFDQSGLLTAKVSGRAYLNSLSDAAAAFSKKVPDSREAMLRRLEEFRSGCNKLIAAPNLQLERTEDREWLIAKCKDWTKKIESHIADLKQGTKDWRKVLAETEETATKMQQALKDKALQLS